MDTKQNKMPGKKQGTNVREKKMRLKSIFLSIEKIEHREGSDWLKICNVLDDRSENNESLINDNGFSSSYK